MYLAAKLRFFFEFCKYLVLFLKKKLVRLRMCDICCIFAR